MDISISELVKFGGAIAQAIAQNGPNRLSRAPPATPSDPEQPRKGTKGGIRDTAQKKTVTKPRFGSPEYAPKEHFASETQQNTRSTFPYKRPKRR